MKVIICGGRNYNLTKDDFLELDYLHSVYHFTEVVSGGAKGADRDGEMWARSRNIPLKIFPAQWDKYGNSAGPRRNQKMADYANACIAFPGGSGTEDMLYRARRGALKIFDMENLDDLL